MGGRKPRSLYIPAGDELVEEQVYRVWKGEDLLFERRGAPAELVELRTKCEPLAPGQRATLGSGLSGDPIVHEGTYAAPEDIELKRSGDFFAHVDRMNRQAVEFGSFAKTFVVDNLAEIQRVREVEAARWMKVMENQAREHAAQLAAAHASSRRPLIDAEGLKAAYDHAKPLLDPLAGAVASRFNLNLNFKKPEP